MQTTPPAPPWRTLLQLGFSFAKIGLFTFGGGLSMLPMLEREMIDHRKWCTQTEILDYYAVGQCTPGVVAVDVAAFIGFKLAGVRGAILAPCAVAAPGVALVLLISVALQHLLAYPWAQQAFVGIRAAVCALLTGNVVRLLRASLNKEKWWQWALCVGAFVPVAVLNLNPGWVVATAAALGLVVVLRARYTAKRGAK